MKKWFSIKIFGSHSEKEFFFATEIEIVQILLTLTRYSLVRELTIKCTELGTDVVNIGKKIERRDLVRVVSEIFTLIPTDAMEMLFQTLPENVRDYISGNNNNIQVIATALESEDIDLSAYLPSILLREKKATFLAIAMRSYLQSKKSEQVSA